jgi:hypothetical protein
MRLSYNRRLDCGCLSDGTSYIGHIRVVAKVGKEQSASVCNLKCSNPPTRLSSINTQSKSDNMWESQSHMRDLFDLHDASNSLNWSLTLQRLN